MSESKWSNVAVKPRERARLRAIAAATGLPIYQVVADALDRHAAELPPDVADTVASLEAIRRHRENGRA